MVRKSYPHSADETQMKPIEGKVWKLGDNISADDGIIQYSQVADLGSFDVPALREMCFKDLIPDFARRVCAGDLVIAGRNFGHHSHVHACVAMKESGIAAVVVESCDTAFMRKALNVGLPVVPCPGASALAEEGERISIDLGEGHATNINSGRRLRFAPFAPKMLQVWKEGGLAGALHQRLHHMPAIGN